MIDKMTHIIPVYKFQGETPLMCIQRIQKAFPYYENLPMTYAGRLDPMADGLLILLAGEECKKKDEYLVLDKTYIVDIAFGISTDTHDVLGVIVDIKAVIGDMNSRVSTILQDFIGKQVQKYPIFSSKTVNGKPLFSYAKEGRIAEISIPEHEVEIFSIDVQNTSKIPFKKLQNKAVDLISGIKGDFRQQEITTSWKAVSLNEISVIRLKVKAGSGTYMRQLAHDLGQRIGFPAIAWHIHRSQIGNFNLYPHKIKVK